MFDLQTTGRRLLSEPQGLEVDFFLVLCSTGNKIEKPVAQVVI